MPDDEQHDKSDDKFNPEAIAARLDKLDHATEEEKLADAEEQKLHQRRSSEKRSGLQAAASKQLAKIGEQAVKRPSAAGIVADDPFAAIAASVGSWMQKNRQTTAAVISMVVLGVAVVSGWTYWQDRRAGQASALLGTAFAAENAPITKDDDSDDSNSVTGTLYPSFKSEDERRAAALEGFRKLEAKFSGTGAAIVARLSEASLLLDAKDAQGAMAAYTEVKASALGQADAEVQGRSAEGIGFVDELLSTQDVPNRDKHLDDAITAYRAVEAVDVDGFKELGMYHRARVLLEKGDKTQALDVLKDVYKRVSSESSPFPYLRGVVEDRLKALDPTALPPPAPKGMDPNGPDMSDPKIQELIKQLQEQQKAKGSAPPANDMPPGEPAALPDNAPPTGNAPESTPPAGNAPPAGSAP